MTDRSWIDKAAASNTTGCPTGKWAYATRRGAKAFALHAARGGARGLRPYLCPECSAWHIGHKPAAVMRGEIGAAEWYGAGSGVTP